MNFQKSFKVTLSKLVRLKTLILIKREERKDKENLKLLLKLYASKLERLFNVDHEELKILLKTITELRKISKEYFMCIINVSTLHRYDINIV